MHRLMRPGLSSVLTGGFSPWLSQKPCKYVKYSLRLLCRYDKNPHRENCTHPPQRNFRGIFSFWDAGGLTPAKTKREKITENSLCRAIRVRVSSAPKAYLACGKSWNDSRRGRSGIKRQTDSAAFDVKGIYSSRRHNAADFYITVFSNEHPRVWLNTPREIFAFKYENACLLVSQRRLSARFCRNL